MQPGFSHLFRHSCCANRRQAGFGAEGLAAWIFLGTTNTEENAILHFTDDGCASFCFVACIIERSFLFCKRVKTWAIAFHTSLIKALLLPGLPAGENPALAHESPSDSFHATIHEFP